MKKSNLNEFDAVSFYQGQVVQQAIQSANTEGPVILSYVEKLIMIVTLVASLGITGWVALAKELNPITAIKEWFKTYTTNRQLAPIIARLKQDPEVMKYANNRNLRGMQKIIASKLSDSEKQYVKKLSREKLTEYVKLRSLIRES